MRFKIIANFLLILLTCAFSNLSLATCSLVGESGSWYKGLSVGAAQITPTIKYVASSGKSGVFTIDWKVTFDQGVKYYYRSPDSWSWSRSTLSISEHIPYDQTSCNEGYILWGQLPAKTNVGTGYVTSTWEVTDFGQQKQIINQVRGAPQITASLGDYMTGVSAQPDYTTTGYSRVTVSTVGVNDGTYTVNIPMQYVPLSVWFQPGSNNWDRMNASGSVDYNSTAYLTFTIRISGGGIVDPVTSCSVGSASIAHGSLSIAKANGDSKEAIVLVNCNGSVTSSLELTGTSNQTGSVLVDMKNGLKTNVSLYNSKTSSWVAKNTNINLSNGQNNFLVRSVLVSDNKTSLGAHSGSAVLTLKYN